MKLLLLTRTTVSGDGFSNMARGSSGTELTETPFMSHRNSPTCKQVLLYQQSSL